MSTPYDSYQQVFALSMLSNRAAGFTGPAPDLQQQLLYELSPYLTMPDWVAPVNGVTPPFYSAPMPEAVAQLGAWTLEWGPAVFQAPTSPNYLQVADNAVFVASNSNFAWPDGSTRTVYVVALAATNPGSAYDWVDEDGTVGAVVEFANGSGTVVFDPANPQPVSDEYILLHPFSSFISLGTATGLKNVLSLSAPCTVYPKGSSPQTLQAFLSTLPSTTTVQTQSGPQQVPTGLIFTGHSLAGALSPTLALYLQAQLSNLTLSSTASTNQILVYPTAGATPGGATFASLFNSKFIQQGACTGYQYWNTDLWNVYDVVPHAWTLKSNTTKSNYLDAIKTLYGLAPSDIVALVDAAEALSVSSGIQYTPIQNASLAGAIQPCTNFIAPSPAPVPPPFPQWGWDAVPGIPLPASGTSDWNDKAFLLQLAVQHIGIYSGIPSIIYFPAAQTSAAIQPPVTGLVLSSRIPPVPQPLGVVSGLTPLTAEEMIDAILTWIAQWIAKHLPASS